MNKAIKLTIVGVIAAAALGCAGYKYQNLTGYNGLTYTRTEESVKAMNSCVQEMKDGTNTVVVLIPDSIVVSQRNKNILEKGKKDFIEFCMADKGFSKL